MKTIYTKPYTVLVRRLKESRKDAGLTQQALADRLGCPQPFVAKYEKAERRLDVLEYLRVAMAIGIDPCKLLKEAAMSLEVMQPARIQRKPRKP